MAVWQRFSRRKPTGGLMKYYVKVKRKRDLGNLPTLTKLADKHKVKRVRVMGGNYKVRVLFTKYINLYIPSQKKTVKTEIINVIENKANREFSKMKIITKGAIVKTPYGAARVTSRPGQDGVVNGVLIEEK